MRKVKKEVKLQLEQVETTCNSQVLTLSTHEYIGDIHSLQYYIEKEEPETLKEFKDIHKLSGKNLVKWLNKNYK